MGHVQALLSTNIASQTKELPHALKVLIRAMPHLLEPGVLDLLLNTITLGTSEAVAETLGSQMEKLHNR